MDTLSELELKIDKILADKRIGSKPIPYISFSYELSQILQHITKRDVTETAVEFICSNQTDDAGCQLPFCQEFPCDCNSMQWTIAMLIMVIIILGIGFPTGYFCWQYLKQYADMDEVAPVVMVSRKRKSAPTPPPPPPNSAPPPPPPPVPPPHPRATIRDIPSGELEEFLRKMESVWAKQHRDPKKRDMPIRASGDYDMLRRHNGALPEMINMLDRSYRRLVERIRQDDLEDLDDMSSHSGGPPKMAAPAARPSSHDYSSQNHGHNNHHQSQSHHSV